MMYGTVGMTAVELLQFLREYEVALAAPIQLETCVCGHQECSTVPAGPCHTGALRQYRVLTGSLAH